MPTVTVIFNEPLKDEKDKVVKDPKTGIPKDLALDFKAAKFGFEYGGWLMVELADRVVWFPPSRVKEIQTPKSNS